MSTPMSTTAVRIGAIALCGVLAYWYWSTATGPKTKTKTPKTSEKKNKTITTTMTSTTTTTFIAHSSKTSSEYNIETGAIPKDLKQNATETIEDTDNNRVATDHSAEKAEEEEPLVTVAVITREISSQAAEAIVNKIGETVASVVAEQKDELLAEENVEGSMVIITTADGAYDDEIEEQEESIDRAAIANVEMSASELTDIDAFEEAKAEVICQVQNLAQENEQEQLAETVEDTFEDDTYEDPIDEFESVQVYEVVSHSTIMETEKTGAIEVENQDHTEADNDEVHETVLEREVPASEPETIQTPTNDEFTEGSDQADTPTTLVGEELELTKDTLQTLQEVSHIAKHSELNARALEFKPSWLASPQQAPISHPEAPQDTAPVKQVTKMKSRCHYWPNCTNKACKYTHPSQPCRDGDHCRFGDRCIFIHPKDQTSPRTKKGSKPASAHGRSPSSSSATMTSVSPVEPWGRA
ncbi:hypothetical protein BGX27_005076 [Mortierella sp. AM989]|nr:hypothetical protein BGX27_005076 [Mortierella sp. AM989]